MWVSAIRVQDKDTWRKLSVVESTECPWKFWLVLVNPDWSKIKWPKGDPGPQWCPWPTWPYICSAGFNGDDIDFGRSDGGVVKLEDAKLCLQWPQWNPWPTGNGICCTQLNPDYTLTLQYTNGCSDTTWSIRWCQWEQWPTWNGICCTICNKTGKETTIELQYTNHTCFCFSVCDWQDWEGSGDVLWPASSVDWDVVAFDGASGKYIKDSGVNISDLARCCDIPTDNSELANGCGYTSCIWTLQACDLCGYAKTCEIPTDNCQLWNGCGYATCCYVNDSINSVTAYYITKDAQWNQFATYAELSAATTFYSWGQVRVPTKNDYTIVLDDENHDNATTRYLYNNGWEYQYTVNETALTQAQLDAINSGITCSKVSCYDNCMAQCCDIPTNNCQLSNGCGYTTCTGTVSSCSDIIDRLWYTPYNSTNPNGYTSCTGTLVPSDLNNYAKCCDIPDVSGFVEESCIATINGCCLTSGWDICIQGWWGANVYWDWSDGDCIIEGDTVMCAREYCFENFIVCSWATLRFCWDWVPVIKACCCIDNQWIIDLKGYDVCSNDYELIFGVWCVKRVANVPFCIPEITETWWLSGWGYAWNWWWPGESWCSSTCPGWSGAVCAGGGWWGRCSSSVAASAGGNATNCYWWNGWSWMYWWGWWYWYIKWWNGWNSWKSWPAWNGWNGYCCWWDGGSNTTNCDGRGGKWWDARYYGGNGWKWGWAAKWWDGWFGYYCKWWNGGDSCWGEWGKWGDSYWWCWWNWWAWWWWDYGNNWWDWWYWYIRGWNWWASRTQYANGNRMWGKWWDSRLQWGNWWNGTGSKALWGHWWSSVMWMYWIMLIWYSVLSCCITWYGWNWGNGWTGSCWAWTWWNWWDWADVMIVYKDSVISWCIENHWWKWWCTWWTTTVSWKDWKDGVCEIIHYAW